MSKLVSRPFSKRHVELLVVKNCSQVKASFQSLVCEDSKQLLPRLYGAFFKFYEEKCPKDVEDPELIK